MKKEHYFPIETNIMSDERLAAVNEKYGAKGIGIYMVLLIELRKHKNYRCGLNSIRQLARTYQLGSEVLERVIHDFDLFTVTGQEDNLTISSHYLDRVMQDMDMKRKKCSMAGKVSANKANRKSNGRFTNIAGTTNNIEEVVVEPNGKNRIKNWKEYLTQALDDKTWLECQAMHSGLGKIFIRHETKIVEMFISHVLTHGTESGILSVKDAKYYFANFIRCGTVTNKRIAKELDKLEQNQKGTNLYRFETIDPVTGERSYYGNIIPPDAPPRPSEKHIWNNETWE